jgi:hypothetical protein
MFPKTHDEAYCSKYTPKPVNRSPFVRWLGVRRLKSFEHGSYYRIKPTQLDTLPDSGCCYQAISLIAGL